MAELLVDGAEVLDIDQKYLERLLLGDAVIHIREEAVTVVELGEGVDAVALSHESQEKHGVGKGDENGVEHDLGVQALHGDADGDNGEHLQEHPVHLPSRGLAVAAEADEDQNHLHDGHHVAKGI